MRPSSRSAPPIAVAALLLLAGCGGGDQAAVYTAPGHPAPAAGPAITVQTAQQAIEDRGADLFQTEQAHDLSDLKPRPVDSSHFTTADSGFFDLYVFVDEAAARAALPDARDLKTAKTGDAKVIQVLNVVVVAPGNGVRSQVAAVRPGLQALAAQLRANPPQPDSTPLGDQEGQEDRPAPAGAGGDEPSS